MSNFTLRVRLLARALILGRGSTGPAVKVLQRAINRRGRSRGVVSVQVDGVLGQVTWDAWEAVYVALGGHPALFVGSPFRSRRRYALVRWPGIRTATELRRASAWKKRRAVELKALETGPRKALAWASKFVGKTENPAGSNRAPWGLTAWQTSFGAWLVGLAWCGVLVGKALQAAGVAGVTSRVAAVRFILDDAIKSTGGFARILYRRSTGSGNVRDGRPGDVLGLFGEGTHTALIEARTATGYRTIEGNTSPGTTGSQDNGGGVWRRERSFADVVFIVRPDYS